MREKTSEGVSKRVKYYDRGQLNELDNELDITDLVPIAFGFSYVLQLSLESGLKLRWNGLTLAVYSLDIPSGRLRNASFASSFNKPKGAVNVCGSLANIAISSGYAQFEGGERSQGHQG